MEKKHDDIRTYPLSDVRKQSSDYVTINFEPTEEEFADFTIWLTGRGNFLPDLFEFLESGYKASISPNPKEWCFHVSISCGYEGMPNCGKVLTTRCADPEKGLQLLYWAHTDVFGGRWPNAGRTAFRRY